MIQLESQIQQSSRITQSGGHLYYQSNRMSKRFTGRKVVQNPPVVLTEFFGDRNVNKRFRFI
jgi:hypothetical protein